MGCGNLFVPIGGICSTNYRASRTDVEPAGLLWWRCGVSPQYRQALVETTANVFSIRVSFHFFARLGVIAIKIGLYSPNLGG